MMSSLSLSKAASSIAWNFQYGVFGILEIWRCDPQTKFPLKK